MSDFEIFEEAFRGNVSGAQGICRGCNKEYYDGYNAYDGEWEENELPILQESKDSVALNHSVGYVIIDGVEYVDGCDCWHKKAKNIIDFINYHDEQIAGYLNTRKSTSQYLANRMPQVGATNER